MNESRVCHNWGGEDGGGGAQKRRYIIYLIEGRPEVICSTWLHDGRALAENYKQNMKKYRCRASQLARTNRVAHTFNAHTHTADRRCPQLAIVQAQFECGRLYESVYQLHNSVLPLHIWSLRVFGLISCAGPPSDACAQQSWHCARQKRKMRDRKPTNGLLIEQSFLTMIDGNAVSSMKMFGQLETHRFIVCLMNGKNETVNRGCSAQCPMPRSESNYHAFMWTLPCAGRKTTSMMS